MPYLSPEIENYLTSLSIYSDDLLREMEEFAAEKNIPILDKQSAQFLEAIVLSLCPKKILEIGTAIGYSAIRMARLTGNDAAIDTIEKSDGNYLLAEENFKRCNLNAKINLLKGEAEVILPSLNGNYDLIFLDADKKDYEKLFALSLPLLRKGGVYLVDNLLWSGFVAIELPPKKEKAATEFIKNFNKLFLSSKELYSTIIPVGDGVGFGVKL